MQKNFIEKHAFLIGMIIMGLMVIPVVKGVVYGFDQKKAQPKLKIVTPIDKKEKPVIEKRVVIDPGHGGYDEGSQSSTGVKEKNVTLRIAKKIGNILHKNDVSVIYTRTSDKVSWPSDNVKDLLKRSEIANASEADYFLSIHANYSDISQDKVKGSEVWVKHDQGENDRLANNVNEQLKKLNNIASRGIKDEETSPLSVLEYNHMPSILIETGFLSNAGDAKILASEKGEGEIANAIAKGVLQTLQKKVVNNYKSNTK